MKRLIIISIIFLNLNLALVMSKTLMEFCSDLNNDMKTKCFETVAQLHFNTWSHQQTDIGMVLKKN